MHGCPAAEEIRRTSDISLIIMNNMANYEWTQMQERLTTLNLYPNPVLAPTKAGRERVKTSRQEQPSETKQTTEERPLDCFVSSSKL